LQGKDEAYCEVCFKNDPGKMDFVDVNIDGYREASVYSDMSIFQKRENFSYWSGYDDGSICDCGAPFFMDEFGFRQPKSGERGPGFMEGSSIVDGGGDSFFSWGGSVNNEKWEEGTLEEYEYEELGKWDSRPPNVAPKSCSKKPDITSILDLYWDNQSLQEATEEPEDWEYVDDGEYEEYEEYEE